MSGSSEMWEFSASFSLYLTIFYTALNVYFLFQSTTLSYEHITVLLTDAGESSSTKSWVLELCRGKDVGLADVIGWYLCFYLDA